MGVESITAISDSGPIIHLYEIQCLPLLTLFQTILIPDAVWTEISDKDRVPSSILEQMTHFNRQTVSSTKVEEFIAKRALVHLHSGERECLYLALQLGEKILLTDDLAVREAAKMIGLTPIGSLGIVVRAYRLGILSQDNTIHSLWKLYDHSTLFITRTLIELAIQEMRTV